MVANVAVAIVSAPRKNPKKSGLVRVGLELSGSVIAAATNARPPKTRLNQKTACHDQNPVSAPPRTGPSRGPNPIPPPTHPGPALDDGRRINMSDHRQRARLRRGRADAITTRPTTNIVGEFARAHTIEPAQKIPTPTASLLAAKVVTERSTDEHQAGKRQSVGATTHWSRDTLVERRLDVGNTALMTVLSRNVRKRIDNSAAKPRLADRLRILDPFETVLGSPASVIEPLSLLMLPFTNYAQGQMATFNFTLYYPRSVVFNRSAYFLSTNVIGRRRVAPGDVARAQLALGQVRFCGAAFDGPTVPVTTLNLVDGIFPPAVMVAEGGIEVTDALQPD